MAAWNASFRYACRRLESDAEQQRIAVGYASVDSPGVVCQRNERLAVTSAAASAFVVAMVLALSLAVAALVVRVVVVAMVLALTVATFVVGVVVNDGKSGRNLGAQAFAGMTLEDAVRKAEREFPSPYGE